MKRKWMNGLIRVLFGIPALLVLTSIIAPLLEASGWPRVANRLYFLLSYVCHQIPSHSLWLFGAPTGISSRSLFLYLAFVGAGLLMLRRRSFLSWPNSVLLMLPIFVDGLTQLAGWRESNNLLRSLTGTMGGIGIAGLVTPICHRISSYGSQSFFSLASLNRTMAGFVILAFLAAVLPYGTARAQVRVAIPEGTRLAVKALESLSSESAKRGETVRLEVVRDVEVKGKVIIKAGAPVTGEVLKALSKKMLGREGELLVGIRYATAVDGTQVPLRASLEEKGEEKLTTTVVLGVVLCPLFLMMKGGEAMIPAGTEYTVFVDRAVEVTVE